MHTFKGSEPEHNKDSDVDLAKAGGGAHDDAYEDIEVGDDDDEEENDATLVKLLIKSSLPDARVTVPLSCNVFQAKQAVVAALGKQAEDRYLRLIVRGRLLAPDSAVLSDLGLLQPHHDVVHAVLAAPGQRGGAQAQLQFFATANNNNNVINGSLNHRRALRGTGLAPNGLAVRTTGDESSSDDDDVGGGEALGFDRLRASSGLRRAEIAALRAYFSSHVDRWMRQNPERAQQAGADEPDARRRRLRHEDAWMQTQGPTSEFRLNLATSNNPNGGGGGGVGASLLRTNINNEPWRSALGSSVGTDRDFVWGFLLGFFVGFLMLVWVWMPTVPHKQKLGILTGISFQLAISMLKGTEDEEDVLD